VTTELVAKLTLVMAGAAWSGLALLVILVPPSTPFALPAFYVLAFFGVVATASGASWLALRPRAVEGRLRTPIGYVGHSSLLAIISLFALWLQSLRVVTLPVVVLLFGLYMFLELALLFGTRGGVELKLRVRTLGVAR
jgi:hypothetical protein